LFIVAARMAARIGRSDQGEFQIDNNTAQTAPASTTHGYRTPVLDRG
jgi:hypothetical protein